MRSRRILGGCSDRITSGRARETDGVRGQRRGRQGRRRSRREPAEDIESPQTRALETQNRWACSGCPRHAHRSFVHSEGQDGARMDSGEGADALVVEIEDGRAVRGQALDEFALCERDAVNGVEVLDMGRADVGNDPEIRSGDRSESADFAGMVHADLYDGVLRFIGKVEERERNADVVVVVANGFARGGGGGENGGDSFLGGGFAALPVMAMTRRPEPARAQRKRMAAARRWSASRTLGTTSSGPGAPSISRSARAAMAPLAKASAMWSCRRELVRGERRRACPAAGCGCRWRLRWQ